MAIEDREWRVSLAGRLAGAAGAAIAMAVGGFLFLASRSDQSMAPWWMVVGVETGCGLVAWLSIRATFRPAIRADASGVTVVNVGRTHTMEWPEILDIRAGYYGITFHRVAGPDVIAEAVQKTNMATWSGSVTRADEVVSELMAHLAFAAPEPRLTSPRPSD